MTTQDIIARLEDMKGCIGTTNHEYYSRREYKDALAAAIAILTRREEAVQIAKKVIAEKTKYPEKVAGFISKGSGA